MYYKVSKLCGVCMHVILTQVMFPAGIEGTPPMGVKRKGKDKKQNKKNSELLCKRDYTMCIYYNSIILCKHAVAVRCNKTHCKQYVYTQTV